MVGYADASEALSRYEESGKFRNFWAEIFGHRIEKATEEEDLGELGESLLTSGKVEEAQSFVADLKEYGVERVKLEYTNLNETSQGNEY